MKFAALHKAVKKGDSEDVKSLLDQGYDPLTFNKKGLNALHIAAIEGHAELIRVFSERGANLMSETEYEKENVLHLAARHNHTEVIRAALEAGCGIDKPRYVSNESAFLLAVGSGAKAAMEMLIENGADTDYRQHGRNAAQIAARNGQLDILEALVARLGRGQFKTQETTALHEAAYSGKMAIIRYLVEDCGLAADALDEDGDTPLSKALTGRYGDCAKYLIEHGADVNHRAPDQGSLANIENYPAFFQIAHLDEPLELIRLAIEKGADIHFTTRDNSNLLFKTSGALLEFYIDQGLDPHHINNAGQSVLHQRYRFNTGLKDAAYLIGRGVDVDLPDREGKTALMIAAQRGQLAYAKLLISHGADDRLKDAEGRSAWELAKENKPGGKAVARYLESRGRELDVDEALSRILGTPKGSLLGRFLQAMDGVPISQSRFLFNLSLGHYALSTLSSLEVKSGLPELIYAARNDFEIQSPEALLGIFQDLKLTRLIPPIKKALSIAGESDFYDIKYTAPQYEKLLKLGDSIPKKAINDIKSHLDTYLRDHIKEHSKEPEVLDVMRSF